MGAEVKHHFLLAFAENHRVGEGTETGDNLNWSSASVVEHAVLESPSVDVPNPACDWAIDKRGPEENEDHRWD